MPQPGDFNARCNLNRWVPERRLNPDEIRDAKEQGRARRFVALRHEKRDRETGQHGRWEYGFPDCDGFETADKAAFEKHMLDEHGRRPVKGDAEAFAASIRAGWRSPRVAVDGKPLSTKVEAATDRCPSCDLIAETGTKYASELWWREHLRGCALAVTSATA